MNVCNISIHIPFSDSAVFLSPLLQGTENKLSLTWNVIYFFLMPNNLWHNWTISNSYEKYMKCVGAQRWFCVRHDIDSIKITFEKIRSKILTEIVSYWIFVISRHISHFLDPDVSLSHLLQGRENKFSMTQDIISFS